MTDVTVRDLIDLARGFDEHIDHGPWELEPRLQAMPAFLRPPVEEVLTRIIEYDLAVGHLAMRMEAMTPDERAELRGWLAEGD